MTRATHLPDHEGIDEHRGRRSIHPLGGLDRHSNLFEPGIILNLKRRHPGEGESILRRVLVGLQAAQAKLKSDGATWRIGVSTKTPMGAVKAGKTRTIAAA